jgi:hypothetical protein
MSLRGLVIAETYGLRGTIGLLVEGQKMLYGKATGGELLRRVVCSPRSPGYQKGSGPPEEVAFY